jgi:hypothetical protein
MRWKIVDEIEWLLKDISAEIADGGVLSVGGVQAVVEGLADGM